MPDPIGFQSFVETVQELWPKCSDTRNKLLGIWHRKLSRNRPEDIGKALRDHQATNFDATWPKWNSIFTMLSSDTQTCTNAFERHLMSLRIMARKEKVKGCEHWTDADVWERWLNANAHRSWIDKEPRRWLNYFAEIGEQPPVYLVA